jgi:hypothetical protein
MSVTGAKTLKKDAAAKFTVARRRWQDGRKKWREHRKLTGDKSTGKPQN